MINMDVANALVALREAMGDLQFALLTDFNLPSHEQDTLRRGIYHLGTAQALLEGDPMGADPVLSWQRARAEFDWLWDHHNRQQEDSAVQFDLGEYCAALEYMLLNRFDEVGLERYSQGREGVAGLQGATDGETIHGDAATRPQSSGRRYSAGSPEMGE